MKKYINVTLFTVLIFFSPMAFGQTDSNTFFKRSETFLNKYVRNGRVDYKSVNNNFKDVESLYQMINNIDLSNKSDAEKKAFYINAYNLIVIYQVSKYYPLKSPLDQSGFFNQVKHKVAGESLTLNALEIKKLILTYKDPRIHFALACAAISCPPLASFAYTPSTLEKQLDERTRKSLNDPEWIKLRGDQHKVYLSKIFDWYKKDFTMNGATSTIDFINQYRVKNIPTSYEVGYYEYNWNLNEM